MKVSDVTLEMVKNYLRVDGDEDDVLIMALMDASKNYIKSYLGTEDLDQWDDLTIAFMCLVADMYDGGEWKTNIANNNMTVTTILGFHCGNFL